MKKLLSLPLVLFVACITANAQNDKKEKEEKIPVFNYVIDDPMDVFDKQPVLQIAVKTVMVPDFYFRNEKVVKDTVYKYECYNAAHEAVSLDSLDDYKLLRFLSLVKTYPDPVHKYKNAEGKDQKLPIQRILNRYDKVGADKWLFIDYINHIQKTLKENVGDIVREDTLGLHQGASGSTITVYKYYRTTEE